LAVAIEIRTIGLAVVVASCVFDEAPRTREELALVIQYSELDVILSRCRDADARAIIRFHRDDPELSGDLIGGERPVAELVAMSGLCAKTYHR
jgi:hypothetical protein